MKIAILYCFLLISQIFAKTYKDNESAYRKYDYSYSSNSFYIRSVNSLRNRYDFIVGVDCSMVSKIEEQGGRYYNYDGNAKDFFALVKENGVNTVRSRLWYNYASNTGVKGGGDNDVARVTKMAVRAKNAGLKFILDFHYSDTWADPGKQDCPYVWRNYNFDKVSNSLYQYTKQTIEYMISKGASIDYVQIGNEINNGLVFPFGKIDWSSDYSKNKGLDNVATLLKSGISAVKAASPSSKIIIHTGDDALKTYESWGKQVPNGLWFFQQMKNRNVNFDIAAVSFYLFYHHTNGDYIDMNTVTNSINQFIDSLGKPFMIMEYSSAFTLNEHQYASNTFGRHHSDIIRNEYSTSFQGQTNFILDLAEKVAQAKNNMGIGVCYWGGDWIPVRGAGWGDPNSKASWSNQALFTYDGLATPALYAMKQLSPN